jgi:prolipoprotein diacylglyceryltransferase
MSEVINFGPFLIKISWLAIAVGGFVGYWVLLFTLKQSSIDRRVMGDIYISSILIIVLFWKLGPLLYNPFILIENPFNILYIYGSSQHIFLGVLFALIYILVKSKKAQIPIIHVFDSFAFAFLPTSIVYHLLVKQYGYPTTLVWGVSVQQPEYKYHPINMYFFIFDMLLFIFLWKFKRKEMGSGVIFTFFLIFYGIGRLLVSFLQPQSIDFLGLSVTQITYMLLMTIGMITFAYNKKTFF